MIRYAQYEKGDHVHARTYCYSPLSGEALTVRGTVKKDDGGRELTILPDKGSNFAGQSMVVYKDRLF